MARSVIRFRNGSVKVTAEGLSEDEQFRELVELLAPWFGSASASKTRGTAGRDGGVGARNAESVKALMKIVRPASAVEAATVFAVAAVDAGLDGVSKTMAEEWADATGFPQPASWSRTFVNAGRSGLICNARYRYWKPTEEGRGFVDDARWIADQRTRGRRKEVKSAHSPRKK
jgi:hypothetical protein